jgi:hypothetical protein
MPLGVLKSLIAAPGDTRAIEMHSRSQTKDSSRGTDTPVSFNGPYTVRASVLYRL